MTASRPKTFLDALARLVDTGWGADANDSATAEFVQALAPCDLMIRGVVEYVTGPDMQWDGALYSRVLSLWGCEPMENTDAGEARRRLAAIFGNAYDELLERKTADAVKAAAEADQARLTAEYEAREAKRRADEAEARIAASEALAKQAVEYAQAVIWQTLHPVVRAATAADQRNTTDAAALKSILGFIRRGPAVPDALLPYLTPPELTAENG